MLWLVFGGGSFLFDRDRGKMITKESFLFTSGRCEMSMKAFGSNL
jgi:hypothetical protein